MKKLMINGKEAVKGQKVTTFRGEEMILVSWREPRHSSSAGKVYVKAEDADGVAQSEFFPKVIGGEFVEDTKAPCGREDGCSNCLDYPCGRHYNTHRE
jgi:hypothetical protein